MINTTHLTLRRYALRLTQKQVSEMVGVTRDHICRIERGKMIPKTKTLVALCRVLKTEPNKVITGWAE